MNIYDQETFLRGKEEGRAEGIAEGIQQGFLLQKCSRFGKPLGYKFIRKDKGLS